MYLSWSADVKWLNNVGDTSRLSMYHQGWRLPDGTYISGMFLKELYPQVTADYKRFSAVFTTPAVVPTTGNLEMSFYIGDNKTSIFAVRRWKLEENNIASAYLPNDSDTYYWNELTLLGITKQIWTPVTQTQWITNGSRYCSGYTLMEPQKEQSRVCYGSFCTTWSDTGNTRNQVIQTNSPSCGYTTNYMLIFYDDGGGTYTLSCTANGSSVSSGTQLVAGTQLTFELRTYPQGDVYDYEVWYSGIMQQSGSVQDYTTFSFAMPSTDTNVSIRLMPR